MWIYQSSFGIGLRSYFSCCHVSDRKSVAERASMANNEGYEYAYGWNVYYQKLLGLWSRRGEGLVARQKAWVWALLIFVSIWLPALSSLPFLDGDLNLIIDSLSTNITISVSIMKIAVFQCQKKVTSFILETMAEDWATIRTKVEHETMWKIAKISRFISILSFSVTNAMCWEYVISQVWDIMQPEEDLDLDPRLSIRLPLISYFPFDTTRPVVFAPLWVGQLLGGFLSGMSYAAVDCIVSVMVLHLCGQLRVIRSSLKNIVDAMTTQEPQEYWKKLSAIIKKHERVNRLGLVIKETISSILLVQMIACSVTFCFQGYALFATRMDDRRNQLRILDLIFFVLYGAYTMIHLFVYCYVGDRLSVESAKISDDFYETSWYNLAPKEAKAFLFVCHNSKTPLELTAGKFCVFNLQLFNAILKNSMGYLSMLMAMKDRLRD